MQPPENPYNQPPLPNPGGDPMRSYGGGMGTNDSGSGAMARLPQELQGLNWGAFLLPVFWGITHKVWIGIAAIVPCVGIIVPFYLLFKGNELGWQNRRFEGGVQQFREVHKKWVTWGLVILAISLCANVASTLAGIGGAARTGNPPTTFTQ